MLSDEDLERYSRQVLVPGIDIDGQARLQRARVVVVGCGGLGCPIALYLAAAGVGHIALFDDDVIEASNLPRQVAFTESDVGRPKVEVLAERLRSMNSTIIVQAIPERFGAGRHESNVADCDLVVDASDARQTRIDIDQTTRRQGKPWLMGAAIQMSGQWLAFSAGRTEGCYACLAPAGVDEAAGGCARLGVLGPVVGAVAMQQAIMAITYLTGSPLPWGRLTMMDYRTGEQQTLTLAPKPGCRSCTS